MGGDVKVTYTDRVAKDLETGETCTAFVPCAACGGAGAVMQTRMVGPGMIQQTQGKCGTCDGRGYVLHDTAASNCIWVDEIKDRTIHLFAGQSLMKPVVLYEKGSSYVNAETGAVRNGDLHVHLSCDTSPDSDWQLFSPRHRHLQWTPELNIVYALLTTRLKCVHPDGCEHVLDMPKSGRTDTLVVPGLGLPATPTEPAGDLFLNVRWDFELSAIAKQEWFTTMRAGLHAKAPWTDPLRGEPAQQCLTTDEYDHHQKNVQADAQHQTPAGGFFSETRQAHGSTASGSPPVHSRPECVQS